ncbi:phytanoyl-CoA dioxygenase family protein [Pseudooceanicola nitratireducens]|uniref:phytanoyl-CoA dioxygenase family protein n=1 Tax=Pseudooceanicola nitratireducens TaxID=517719 RepID=UPI003510E858
MNSDNFAITDSPADITPFDPTLKWSPDLVDYSRHPAYRGEIAGASAGLKGKALLQFTKSMLPLLVKRAIRYEMIPVEIRSPKTAGDFIKLLGAAGRNALGLHAKMPLDSAAQPVFDVLDRDGCCVVKMDEHSYEGLHSISRVHFARLEERRAATAKGDRDFDESRSNVDAREHGNDLYDELNRLLEESGILAAASRYLGRKARLIDVNPQINDASDSFWRTIFPDLEDAKLPASAYYHRDASGGDLKAIFYMTDVGPENGPFSYVVGSNKLSMSRLDDLIAEANDHNGLSSTNPDARRRFAALPAKLRQKGAFGNDLEDDAQLAEQIRKGVWSITGPKGSIVLFDTKGVHRGGMVVEGHRYVITTVIG